jgi:hypothetical protein
MRTFCDETGRLWEVAVGRASYGTQLLIFSRRDGSEIRQVLMDANSPLDAENELNELGIEDLRRCLDQSEEWH